jgi:predicted transcriptional regulator
MLPMGDSTTIRVRKEIYNTIKSLAVQQNGKIQDVIEQAVNEYKKKKFFEELNAGYARLRADRQAWAEEKSERKAWEATLRDGLEDQNDH